ncbi:MAG: hypothetical protein ACUVT7_08305 [Thermoplasmata archaeon]
MGGPCLQKRDWGTINRMLREEAGRFVRTAKRIVDDEQEPWIWNPKVKGVRCDRMGRPPTYMARPMVVLCLFKIYYDKSFRWIEGFLRENGSLCRGLGFVNGCPSYETIRRAMLHMDESYLRALNKRVLAELRKT